MDTKLQPYSFQIYFITIAKPIIKSNESSTRLTLKGKSLTLPSLQGSKKKYLSLIKFRRLTEIHVITRGIIISYKNNVSCKQLERIEKVENKLFLKKCNLIIEKIVLFPS